MAPIVTFLTDFGAGSGYPAQMKAVVLCRLPEARLVDVSHEIAQYDVLGGALLLEACVRWFPLHAVHCAVVDPGVGTARRAICVVDAEGRRLVGPDNGLFTAFLGGAARVYELTSAEHAPRADSATFHGRDLFAPVAAWLAGGGEPDRLGPAVADPVRLDWRDAVRDGDTLTGEVLAVDTFGNLVTSIRLEVLGGRAPARVEVLGRRARVVRTFGDGGPGELVALVGSSGRLEIAVREGSALRALGVGRGAPVVAWIADSR
jgi:S-adenosylmethionine hydrolase